VKKKPLIGITPEAITIPGRDGSGSFCRLAYSQAIAHAGGLPVALPLTDDTALLEEYFHRCDGILLAGGGDVSEASAAYGRKLSAKERNTLSGISPVRDAMEIFLVRQSVENDKPLLGICRGIQMMNVALGGTLLPDIPNHREPHGIEWAAGRRLIPCDRVNSRHHQALNSVAPTLEVLARSGDGIIEAVAVTGMTYGVGVQFHPERLISSEPEFLRIFTAFVRAGAM
jgi:putative glutamine amidotransferase